ncbi:hypothetical protein CTAYLR_007850 [Chrysophaeum taylorii]|uniref:Uncharacterized protein n=1 Tax=Chrysophaeum taylorii TaxID=2483200 RepID=A0AAD7XL39_9STRA|nr:hypothetical protein CTAYLR_007850 [Chrysophaeum taylorii]
MRQSFFLLVAAASAFQIHHRQVAPRLAVVSSSTKAPQEKITKDLKRKLLQEASTPWRSVRLFFYGAFAFSAGVGLATALAQLAASATHQPGALPLSQSATNVGVDVAVVAACALGYRVDSRAAADVVSEPDKKALSAVEAAERTELLARLRVEVGTDDNRREASLETLRTMAGQSVVVLGGPRAVVDDALTDALIQQKLLARAECVVVPVRVDATASSAPPQRKKIDTAGFVATPAPDDADAWVQYLGDEIATAVAQGEPTAATAGVVIAVRRDGTIARRGVGKPPWRDVINDLQDDDDDDATAAGSTRI